MESVIGWTSLAGILLWTWVLTHIIKLQDIEKRFRRVIPEDTRKSIEQHGLDPTSESAELAAGEMTPEHIRIDRFLWAAEIGSFVSFFGYLINLMLWMVIPEWVHPSQVLLLEKLQIAMTIAATAVCITIIVKGKRERQRASAYLLAQLENKSE